MSGSPVRFDADGRVVRAVTAAEMAEVDRVATDEVGLHLLSMMENAGRALAAEARDHAAEIDVRDDDSSGEESSGGDSSGEDPRDGVPVTVLAGAGGNGGGGLVAARHLANAGHEVRVVLDRAPDEVSGVPARQLGVLDATDATVAAAVEDTSGLAVDAIVGYGLDGPLEGRAAELAERAAEFDRTLSLDVPSGLNATTGDVPGPAVDPDATLTLALPKSGLADLSDLVLADVGIPTGVFERAGVPYSDPFDGADRVALTLL